MEDFWDEMSYYIYCKMSQHDRLVFEYVEDIHEIDYDYDYDNNDKK